MFEKVLMKYSILLLNTALLVPSLFDNLVTSPFLFTLNMAVLRGLLSYPL